MDVSLYFLTFELKESQEEQKEDRSMQAFNEPTSVTRATSELH